MTSSAGCLAARVVCALSRLPRSSRPGSVAWATHARSPAPRSAAAATRAPSVAGHSSVPATREGRDSARGVTEATAPGNATLRPSVERGSSAGGEGEGAGDAGSGSESPGTAAPSRGAGAPLGSPPVTGGFDRWAQGVRALVAAGAAAAADDVLASLQAFQELGGDEVLQRDRRAGARGALSGLICTAAAAIDGGRGCGSSAVEESALAVVCALGRAAELHQVRAPAAAADAAEGEPWRAAAERLLDLAVAADGVFQRREALLGLARVQAFAGIACEPFWEGISAEVDFDRAALDVALAAAILHSASQAAARGQVVKVHPAVLGRLVATVVDALAAAPAWPLGECLWAVAVLRRRLREAGRGLERGQAARPVEIGAAGEAPRISFADAGFCVLEDALVRAAATMSGDALARLHTAAGASGAPIPQPLFLALRDRAADGSRGVSAANAVAIAHAYKLLRYSMSRAVTARLCAAVATAFEGAGPAGDAPSAKGVAEFCEYLRMYRLRPPAEAVGGLLRGLQSSLREGDHWDVVHAARTLVAWGLAPDEELREALDAAVLRVVDGLDGDLTGRLLWPIVMLPDPPVRASDALLRRASATAAGMHPESAARALWSVAVRATQGAGVAGELVDDLLASSSMVTKPWTLQLVHRAAVALRALGLLGSEVATRGAGSVVLRRAAESCPATLVAAVGGPRRVESSPLRGREVPLPGAAAATAVSASGDAEAYDEARRLADAANAVAAKNLEAAKALRRIVDEVGGHGVTIEASVLACEGSHLVEVMLRDPSGHSVAAFSEARGPRIPRDPSRGADPKPARNAKVWLRNWTLRRHGHGVVEFARIELLQEDSMRPAVRRSLRQEGLELPRETSWGSGESVSG